MDAPTKLKLIKLVQRHKCLYHRKYRKEKKIEKIRQKSWRQIAEELNIPIFSAKHEWRKIRDRFRQLVKYRKKIPCLNLCTYEEELFFLMEHMWSEKFSNKSDLDDQKISDFKDERKIDQIFCKSDFSCSNQNEIYGQQYKNNSPLTKNFLNVVQMNTEIGSLNNTYAFETIGLSNIHHVQKQINLNSTYPYFNKYSCSPQKEPLDLTTSHSRRH